jgi:hypothetical protein
MSKILKFENFATKKELDKIAEFAQKELSAPVQLSDRRPQPKKKHIVNLRRPNDPPKRAA